MFKLKLLVVLYNRLPIDSETIQSIIAAKNEISHCSELIIWDNSIHQLSDNDLFLLDSMLTGIKYKYCADGKNTFLSKIYNQVISTLDFNDYLVILDHDSTFGINFFCEIITSINKNPNINLFLPLVYSQDKLVSPADLKYFRGNYWEKKRIGLIKSKNIHAINSGMVISGRYLKSKFKGYNENLKFYGTDNDFIEKFSQDNEYLYVLDTEIAHILNFHDSSSVEDKIFRFKSMREGSLINMKIKGLFVYFVAKIYFLLLAIKMILKYKNFRFISK